MGWDGGDVIHLKEVERGDTLEGGEKGMVCRFGDFGRFKTIG